MPIFSAQRVDEDTPRLTLRPNEGETGAFLVSAINTERKKGFSYSSHVISAYNYTHLCETFEALAFLKRSELQRASPLTRNLIIQHVDVIYCAKNKPRDRPPSHIPEPRPACNRLSESMRLSPKSSSIRAHLFPISYFLHLLDHRCVLRRCRAPRRTHFLPEASHFYHKKNHEKGFKKIKECSIYFRAKMPGSCCPSLPLMVRS